MVADRRPTPTASRSDGSAVTVMSSRGHAAVAGLFIFRTSVEDVELGHACGDPQWPAAS